MERENAFVVEKECERAHCSEVSRELVENGTHVGHRSRGVVGERVDENGDSVGAVSLVGHALVVALVFAHCVLNGALNVVVGHVFALGVGNDCAQVRVVFRLRSAFLNCNGYLFSNLGESAGHVSPPFQFRCFAVFKCSSHWFELLCFVVCCIFCLLGVIVAALRACSRGYGECCL